MPKLTTPKPDVKRFYLPSTKALPQEEQAYVDLDASPIITGDLLDMDDKGGAVKMGADLLASRIKAWNFTEEDGTTPVAISVDAVCRMELSDFSYLSDQIDSKGLEGLTKSQKKA